MMKNENGRSMVEMLGVLAIIGVLSVAGIAGYTMAMRKYRANEILNVASQMVILAKSTDGGVGTDATTPIADLGLDLPVDATAMTVTNATTDNPTVAVTGPSYSANSPCTVARDGASGYTITCANTAVAP